MFRAIIIALVASSAVAFAPARIARQNTASKINMFSPSVFENAVKGFAETYPQAYNRGWGPTPLAERWNGRHAMFGWVALIATAYAKGHNLFPEGDVSLNVNDWGTLAYIYGGSITNERAIILIGHLHCLFVSLCATIAPLSTQQKLYYEPGSVKEAAAGLIPKANVGITESAELINGRMAMLGLVALVGVSTVYQMPILDVINAGVGGLYGASPLMGTAGAALALKVSTVAAPVIKAAAAPAAKAAAGAAAVAEVAK